MSRWLRILRYHIAFAFIVFVSTVFIYLQVRSANIEVANGDYWSKKQNFKQAVLHYKNALPNSEAQRKLGRIFMHEKKYNEAVKYYGLYLKNNTDTEAKIEYANALFECEEYQVAAGIYDSLHKQFPYDPHILTLRARCYYNINKVLAIQMYEKSLEISEVSLSTKNRDLHKVYLSWEKRLPQKFLNTVFSICDNGIDNLSLNRREVKKELAEKYLWLGMNGKCRNLLESISIKDLEANLLLIHCLSENADYRNKALAKLQNLKLQKIFTNKNIQAFEDITQEISPHKLFKHLMRIHKNLKIKLQTFIPFYIEQSKKWSFYEKRMILQSLHSEKLRAYTSYYYKHVITVDQKLQDRDSRLLYIDVLEDLISSDYFDGLSFENKKWLRNHYEKLTISSKGGNGK